jgi:hypothetical protein
MRRPCWIVAVLATAVFAGGSALPPAHGGQGAVTVASGATKIARWELYVSAPRPGRRCVGIRVEQLWAGPRPAGRRRCGTRRLARAAVTLHTLAAPGMGSFAFGRAGRQVERVRLTVGDLAPVIVATLPSPLGSRDRFWVAPAGLSCAPVSIQGLGVRGKSHGGRCTGRIGAPGCGAPEP